MTVSPNGEWLAVGCSDGIIHILNIPALLFCKIEDAEKMTFAQHSLPVSDLKFSSSSRWLYSCSLDQTCKIWSFCEKLLLASISFPTILNCLALSPIEDSVYVGGGDGNIYKIDTWTIKGNDFNVMSNIQNLPQIFRGNHSVNCIDLNIDGSLLVSGSEDGLIKVWSSSSCQLLQTLPQQFKGSVTHLQVLLRPPTVSITGTSKSILPQITLSNIPYVTEELETFPVKLSNKKRLFSSIHREESKDTKKERQAPTTETNQVQALQDEITSLKETNQRWKLLNNQLLQEITKPPNS